VTRENPPGRPGGEAQKGGGPQRKNIYWGEKRLSSWKEGLIIKGGGSEADKGGGRAAGRNLPCSASPMKK